MRDLSRSPLACILFFALGAGLVLAVSPPVKAPAIPADHARKMADSRDLFARSVRKTLGDNCLKCHGQDKTRGGLDLATRDTLLKGGDNGPAVVPGKGVSSRLVRLASHLDEPHMPPASGGGKKLSPAQLADLSRWIDLGAAYDRPLVERPDATKPKMLVVTNEDRKFWSFRPLARPAVPAVANAGWAVNPIDRFILAKLEAKGLTPTPQADGRTLVRRLSFDLLGLPPSPEEIEAFDRSAFRNPGLAIDQFVDRLLASPAHGERYARHWLDVVRFAESHGFEHDYDRPHAYPYRDFVIKALNLDLPYDTFVKWQLAGDEFAANDPLALTATGFLGAGVHSTQITANTVEKERYDELDDIVRTMGTAFLGLTVGCARCHDHKYDPIPTRDYYRLLSTFTKTVRSDQDIDLDPDAAQAARRRHQAEVERRSSALERYEKTTVRRNLRDWLARSAKASLSPWSIVEPTSVKSSGGATFTALGDGSYLASGKNPNFDTYTFVVETKSRDIRAVRLEALADPSLVKGGPGRAANGNFALSDVKITQTPLPAGKPIPVTIHRARATFEQRGLPVSATIDGDPRSAWAVDPRFGQSHAAVFDLASPIGHAGGTRLTITLRFANNTGHNIGRPRLSLSTQVAPEAVAGEGMPQEVRQVLTRLKAKPGSAPTSDDETVLLRWYRHQDGEWRKRNGELEELRRKGAQVTKMKAMICSEGLPPVRLHSQGGDFLEQTHFLNRGDANQKMGVATQGFLQVLMRAPEGEKRWQVSPPTGSRTPYLRRSLANWISDVEHGGGHLLARVIVNRLWQYHFGRGLVATSSDFGLQGEKPTHPELLDWLACELIANDWRLKPIHRLILTSATYRQGTAFDRNKADVDVENRLLWRRTPRRLEAEVIRDGLLAVSGQLDRRMFGPGTLDRAQKRRSIYFFVKRSQLVPMMVLFDAPDGTVGIEQRTNTTIAPQALLLLNSPVVRKASEDLARRLGQVDDPGHVVKAGYALALGRKPGTTELADSIAFLKEQRTAYAEERKADPEHLALVDFCQVLMGLNEFVYID